jgi:hypothetical protein
MVASGIEASVFILGRYELGHGGISAAPRLPPH